MSHERIIKIQRTIEDQLCQVVKMYKDPSDIIKEFDQPDFVGKSSFHYIKEFDLHKLMNTDSLQELIEERWDGWLDLNYTVFEYSTAYKLFKDKYGFFKSQLM